MRAEEINSIESEAGVIASLIKKPELIFYSDFLLPNHFTDKANRLVYTAIQDLVNRGITTIDPYNILEDLNSSEATRKLAEGLSVNRLQELVDMSEVLARSTRTEYEMLVTNVMNAAFRRDTFNALKECETVCLNGKSVNVGKKIYELIDNVMVEFSTTDDVPEFSEQVDQLWTEIKAHQDGQDAGIPFKFPTLNEYVTIEQGELVVVGAPAKGAKSMFMMNEAIDILKRGKSVMYIDSELSSRLFLCRVLSHLTGIEFSRIRSGTYGNDEEARILESLDWLKNQKLVHIYMPIFSMDTIYASVKKVSHKFGKLDVLIVDYLKPTGNSEDAYAVYGELGKLTDMIKNDICGAMGVAGLAAAQLTSAGKLADSAKIARNASTILLMVDKTSDDIEVDGYGSGNKKLIVAQNRNGMQHVSGEWINLDFVGNFCTLNEAKVKHVLSEDPF